MRLKLNQILRLINNFLISRGKLLGNERLDLFAADAAGWSNAGSAAGDQVHERLKEIDAAIAHITNLLGLGECIGDITRLAGGPCLQHQGRCACEHWRTEGCSPPCRVVAARIGGDYAFPRSGEGDYA